MLENGVDSDVIYHRRLFRLTARFYGIKPTDITGPYKGGNVRIARRVVAYILYNRRNLSYASIGVIMNRDHSTVLHNVHRMESLLIDNPSLMEIIEAIDRGSFDAVKPVTIKPKLDHSTKIPKLASQYACANFGSEEKHAEKSWYLKQNQAYVEAVRREHGEWARW